MAEKYQVVFNYEEVGILMEFDDLETASLLLNVAHILPKKKVSGVRRAIPQVLALTAKNILILCWGLALGFPTILIPSLQGNGDPNETVLLDENGISWIGSLNYLCVPVGCILSGPLTSAFGRRRSLQLVNIPFLAAWLVYYFSTQAWHIFLALGLAGLSGGLLEAPVMTYAAEVAEPSLRGTLTFTTFVSGNLGIFISFFIGSLVTWRTVALINASVPIIAFVALTFIPESPYWLLSKDKIKEAKKSLAWLRGWVSLEDIEEEFTKLKEHVEKEEPFSKKINWDNLKMFYKPAFLKPFLLTSFGFVLCHFGSTPMVTYAIPTFTLLQVPISSYNAIVYMGMAPIISSTLSTISVKFLGKRVLSFISLGGEIVFLVILASYTISIGANQFSQTIVSSDILEHYNFVPLLGMIGHSFFAFLMVRPLSWMLIGEFFGNDLRATACGVCSAVANLIGFVANKVFLKLVNVLTLGGVFLFYAGLAILGIILFYLLLPETEGKTLSDTAGHYSGRTKLNNKVYKKSNIVINEQKT